MSDLFDGKCGLIWYAGNPDIWPHLHEVVPDTSGKSRCFTSVYELWAEEVLDQSGLTKHICINVDTLGREELAIFSCLAGRRGVTTVAVSAWPDNPKLILAKESGASRISDIPSVRNILQNLKNEPKQPEKSEQTPPDLSAESGKIHWERERGEVDKKSPPVIRHPILTEEEWQALSGPIK